MRGKKVRPKPIEQIIQGFYRTSKNCERLANFFLIVAFITMALGIIAFAFSGRKFEMNSAENLSEQRLTYEIEIEKLNLYESISRKVGITILTLFFVQLIIRNFRYNKRIGNFYAARAQALEYLELKGKCTIKEAMEFFNTDNIEVGISPPPTDVIPKFGQGK